MTARDGHDVLGICSAGVWRRKTVEAVGGWNSRTTVEDMDLSIRTYLAGWKSVYLRDTTCLNEVGYSGCGSDEPSDECL